MKTNLNRLIYTREEALQYTCELFLNNEIWHFEDSAHDVVWESCSPTEEQKNQMDVLSVMMFSINGFDPLELALTLVSGVGNVSVFAEQGLFADKVATFEKEEDYLICLPVLESWAKQNGFDKIISKQTE